MIQRKDLPRIYTMCLPPSFQARSSADQSAETESLGQGLVDLESTREDVRKEVLNAPKRRVDNEISRLTDSVALLQLHCAVVDDIIAQYRLRLVQSRLVLATSAISAVASVAGGLYLSLAPLTMVEIMATGGLVNLLLYLYQQRHLSERAAELVSPHELEASFRRLYSRQVVNKDEFSLSLWTRVFEHLKLSNLSLLPS